MQAKKPQAPDQANAHAERTQAPDAQGETTPAKGQRAPRLTLSASVDAGYEYAGPSPILGALPPAPAIPDLPPAISDELNARERLIVLAMVNGASYAQALRQTARLDGADASQTRTDAIPPAVVAAVAHIFRALAASAGLSRAWIISQTVALFERACAAVPVLDRRGRPTGEYRFDGPTAANCLKMLAEWNGELYPRRGGGIAPSDVADLLAAVASRGRPALDARRAPLLIELSSAAKASEPST